MRCGSRKVVHLLGLIGTSKLITLVKTKQPIKDHLRKLVVPILSQSVVMEAN